jgi:hypothetical protein
MGASVGADSADTSTESRKRDGPDGKLTLLDQQEDGAGGEVWIHGIAQDHGDAHGWCDDQVRNGMVAGLHDIGLADQEFTVMAGADESLHARLEVGSEVPGVQCVNAAVHEPKAVRGADDCVAGQVEDGPEVDANAGEIAAESGPGIGEVVVDGSEDGFHE